MSYSFQPCIFDCDILAVLVALFYYLNVETRKTPVLLQIQALGILLYGTPFYWKSWKSTENLQSVGNCLAVFDCLSLM